MIFFPTRYPWDTTLVLCSLSAFLVTLPSDPLRNPNILPLPLMSQLKRLAAYLAPVAKSYSLKTSLSLLVLSGWVSLFAFVVLDGYVLYFLNLPSNPWIILVVVAAEFAILVRWFISQHPQVDGDPLELAGFLIVLVGVWLYFVYPSWPTLLPPTHHGDAANHAAFADAIYSSGYLFATYPAGAALLIATFAHWIGWSDFRILHLTGSLFMALTAAGIYGLACEMLPGRRQSKTIALFSVLALFVTWGYFAGIVIGLTYFLTQAVAQFFVVAFIWFLGRQLRSFHPAWGLGMAGCLIGISVSWQLWLAVPLAALGLAVVGQWRSGGVKRQEAVAAAALALVIPAIFWAALIITSPELFPAPAHLYNSGGAILTPSLESLGGAYLVLPIIGVLLLYRSGYRSQPVILFLVASLLLSAALVVWRLILGLAVYWVDKSFYMLILPMALLAVVPIARAVELVEGLNRPGQARVAPSTPLRSAQGGHPERSDTSSVERSRRGTSLLVTHGSVFAFGLTVAAIVAAIMLIYPAPIYSPLSESDLETAVWAKQNLETSHVNWIGKKSLIASWIGNGIWGEKYPRDLFVDLLALGPKTFPEWRTDPGWGEYVLATSRQELPADPTLKVVYKNGSSAILQKPTISRSSPASPPIAAFGRVFGIAEPQGLPDTIQGGSTISFTARLEPLGIPSNKVVWRLQFRDRDYRSVADTAVDPFDDRYPFQRWPIGSELSQPFTLTVPSEVEAGRYNLQLGLYYETNGAPLPIQPAAMDAGDVLELASIKVAPTSPTDEELSTSTRVNAGLGDSLILLGYRLAQDSPVTPGADLKLTLYWKCLAPVNKDYTVFVHLLDPSGNLRFQRDNAPRNGKYPTSLWSAGEIVADSYELTIPAEAAPGSYQLEVGLYEWPSLKRLSVSGGDQGAESDHVNLPLDVRFAP